MVQYILLVIACQLLFLVLYDLLLKKATFFNYNRAYLLITPVASIILPLVKIPTFKNAIPHTLTLPYFTNTPHIQQLIQLDGITVTANNTYSFFHQLPIWQWVLITGIIISTLVFTYKCIQLYNLTHRSLITVKSNYTEVIVPKSSVAFSFFNYMFLGDSIKQQAHHHIIKHELVHIQQKHSYDLIFFEFLKIVFWFSPLVYMYQIRITELHEYIVDNKTDNTNKKQQLQWLLQEAFQTQGISFINNFFNQSLIKKRIVMLQKSRSKKTELFKYILLLPMVIGMLAYVASCSQDSAYNSETETAMTDEALKKQYLKDIEAQLASGKNIIEMTQQFQESHNYLLAGNETVSKEDFYHFNMLIYKMFSLSKDKTSNELAQSFLDKTYEEYIKKPKPAGSSTTQYQNTTHADTPFTIVYKKPMFSGCENATDLDTCFKEKLDDHVRHTFSYPIEAQKQGIQGRVYVQFRINTEGVTEVLGVRGPSKYLDNEAKRIIESLPKMTPGEDKNGDKVNVTFAYPIVFRLN